jgi:hypothetical protein
VLTDRITVICHNSRIQTSLSRASRRNSMATRGVLCSLRRKPPYFSYRPYRSSSFIHGHRSRLGIRHLRRLLAVTWSPFPFSFRIRRSSSSRSPARVSISRNPFPRHHRFYLSQSAFTLSLRDRSFRFSCSQLLPISTRSSISPSPSAR